jgi:phosphoribosylanthranilate isomerase
MVFAIRLGFSPLAWHSPVRSQSNFPKKISMHTWIKICGTTCLEDALKSVEAGADALGFIFAPSKRGIVPKEAQEIIRRIPAEIERIGVFFDNGAQGISRTVSEVDLTGIQMHGPRDFPPEVYEHLADDRRDSLRKIKTILVDVDFARNLEATMASSDFVDAWLLDSGAGSGKTFDWQAARAQLGERQGRFIVAGGLTPENVADAIRAFKPWGVDVVTGVEREPGRKDPEKLKAFVAAVRRAEET